MPAWPNRRLHRLLGEAKIIARVSLPRGPSAAIDLDRVHRDSCVYADPERMVPDRRQKGRFGFGAGVHACQGTGMGLVKAVCPLEALLSAWEIAPAASPPTLCLDRSLRSFERLPLRVFPVERNGIERD